ncbi:Telomere end binding protein [Metarhizium album ARSEF 1941]|uniref:Telomere end binding protein n=1 Tax=Metarhizium album (strain ARSEF 1941) TaxID=1081103 RepID=A0A0B2WQ77_METAS|nr:Telomere end binding protein [Metarhizium album ARSEF 1941]KHN95754.1 Telomere end binding protein [Metarhizium album ARSEF 1941]
MDKADRPPLEALDQLPVTPIAQLSPQSAAEESRVVDGVVTITWPYSAVTKSIAFILAEHDILVRRDHGQVRIELHGPSGKAFADANIGGGDQLRISLDGAQWTRIDAKTGLPVGPLEWQLNFTNRLLLSVQRLGSEGSTVIDLNAPEDLVNGVSEPGPNSRITPPREPLSAEDEVVNSTPLPPSTVPSKRLASNTFDMDEYASPAFIKRARVSYGSLFEGEPDLFGDDKGKRKNGGRKSRFSMGNAVWRYSSRSPSPEAKDMSEPESPENESKEEMHATADSSHIIPTPQRSAMVDEGSQTQEHGFHSPMHVQVPIPAPELTASPLLGLFSETGPTSHTPSRNLFSRPQPHHGVSGVALATSQHDDSLGVGLSRIHVDMVSNGFGAVSAPAELVRSQAPSLGATAVPSYPDFATTEQAYAGPVLYHDQNLQFQEHDAHSTNPEFQPISEEANTPWHPEAVSSYPPVPSERQDPQVAVIIEGSPSLEVETSRDAGFRTSQASAEDERAPRDQEASPIKGQVSTLGGEQPHFEDDGGDIKGEDYDLRNYAHTRDDEAVLEEMSDAPGSHADQLVVDSEDGDTSEEEYEGDEEADDVGVQHRGSSDGEQDGFSGSESDEMVERGEEEERYYEEEGTDEEDGYDEDEGIEEDYDEEDYDEEGDDGVDGIPAPSKPQEPVCIDLISDSDDEEEEDETPNEELQHDLREEQDQREDEASPPEAETIEQDMEEPATVRQPDDREVEEDREESSPAADEVDEDYPVQTSTSSQDAEVASVVEDQEAHDEMDVDEETSEPAHQNVVGETEMPGTVVQQTTEDDMQKRAWHEEDETEASLVEGAEKRTSEVDASEEQTVVQGPSPDTAGVEMTESVPAVDAQEPAAKQGEPAVEQEPERGPGEAEAAEHVGLPPRTEPQGPEEIAGPLPSQEQEEYDDAAAAEDQIMKEYQEYQSPAYKGSAARVQPSTEAPAEAPEQTHPRESDVPITVRSLRSRRQPHQKTQSVDSTGSAHEDPSVLLARASSPTHSDELEPEPAEATNEPSSPGMLRILGRAKPDHADPSVLLARSSPEPSKRDETPGPTVRVTRSMTEHTEGPSSPTRHRTCRRPATPETQTTHRDDQTLASPSIAGSVVEDESLSTLKRQLQKDLRTRLPDYAPLRSLRTSLNKTVDVLAVATSTPPQPHRPKHGPRDYMLELTLSDPSSAPSGISVAHIFRPHQASLPVVHKGDAVLLRRVTVVSMKGRGFGVRVSDASAWAVFETGDEEMLPQIKGPPVEVADDEVEYAGGLKKWWAALDQTARSKIDRATQKVAG